MSNLGFNILGSVQGVIGKQSYQLEKWLSRARNDSGFEVDTYDDPVDRQGGVYPVSRERMNLMGLDMEKIYIQIFDVDLIALLDREKNADRIIYLGYYWHPMPSANDFVDSGGWNQVLAVRGKKVA